MIHGLGLLASQARECAFVHMTKKLPRAFLLAAGEGPVNRATSQWRI